VIEMRKKAPNESSAPFVDRVRSYLPIRSTLPFSASFIFLMVGSRGASPVVWFVVAGGPSLGRDDCPGGVVAGCVAVAGGGDVDWAVAACANNKRALDSRDAASAVEFDFIYLTPVGYLAPFGTIKMIGAV
jgi:hypothetical protein